MKYLNPAQSFKSSTLFSAFATTLLLLPHLSFGQAAPQPADVPPATSGGDVVQLNPFVINEANDKGYDTNNTLSGTRLNTPSKYIGSAVTDISTQLMDDLNLTNMEDLVDFMPNSSSFFGGGVNTDLNGNNGLFSAVYNSRGFEVTSLSRDFLTWRVPDDEYDTERFSDDRGPNSVLFGIGNPGGTFNSVSKRAKTNDTFYEVSIRGDTNGSRRGSFDLNQVLFREKLAIRIDGLSEDAMTNRHPSDRDSDRLYGTITYTPFSSTTLTVNAEQGRIQALNVRPWAASDGITAWQLAGSQEIPSNLTAGQVNYASTAGSVPAGKPTVAVNTAQLNAAGFESQINSTYNMFVTGSAAYVPPLNGDGFVTTARVVAPDGTNLNTLVNSPIPYTDNILGYGNQLDQNFGNFTVNLEQKIVDHLYIQATYNQQQTNNWNDYSSGQQDNIYIDKNPTLYTWSGTTITNPNYGKYFSMITGVTSLMANYSDQTARLMASYELNLKDKIPGFWGTVLGHHNFALLRERDSSLYNDTTIDLRNITLNQNNGADIPASALTNIQTGQTNFAMVHYFTPGQSPSGIAMPNLLTAFPKILYAGTPLPPANPSGVTPAWVANSDVESLTHINSQMLVDQNYFWNDRIVTTFGLRRDVEDIWNLLTSNDPADNYYTYAANTENIKSTQYAPLGEFEQVGQTETAGIVVTPVKWLGLFYNYSDNFIPSGTQADIFDTPLPNGRGIGHDYGVRFYLSNDRLTLSIDRYNTDYNNIGTTIYRSGSTNLSAIEADIAGGMETAVGGPMWNGTYPGWDSHTRTIYSLNDEDSEGDEVTLTANPLPNWRLMANASYQKTQNLNYGQTEYKWLYDFAIPYFNANPQYLSVANTGSGPEGSNETVAQRLLDAQNILTLAQSLNGKADARQAEYTVNLVTGYDFTGPFLRNVGVGGTFQWRSKIILGYPFAAGVTNLYNTTSPYYSAPTNKLGLFFNYKFKLLRSLTRVQLNVNGITSRANLIPYSEVEGPNGAMAVERFYVGPGTSAVLKITQDF